MLTKCSIDRCRSFLLAVAILSSPLATSQQSVDAADVTAYSIVAEYVANQVSADAKYGGKTLTISGTVQGIKKSYRGEYFLSITGTDKLRAIEAYFVPGDVAKLGSLKVGQKIEIEGRVGKFDGWDLSVEQCVLLSPEITVSKNKGTLKRNIGARELVALYSANQVSADATYGGKTLTISGTVQGIKKNYRGEYFLSITGTDKLHAIEAYFVPGDVAKLGSLKVGQKVEIKGRVGKFDGWDLSITNCNLGG